MSRSDPILIPLLLSAALLLAPVVLPAADLYIAPDGNDAWSGTIPSANAGRTDGPLATIAAAQAAVRTRIAQHVHPAGITIALRGGSYALTAPWTCGPDDSGTEAAPIRYTAFQDEVPVISGGVRLTGFAVDAHGRWTLHIPEVAAGTWTFSQLWVGGERRYRPRSPAAQYHVIAGSVTPSPQALGKGYDRFRFSPGDILGTWSHPEDLEVLCFHQWEMSRLRIASIDSAHAVVQFTGRTCSADDWAALKAGWRYQVDNVGEALALPGEWYLDRPLGLLTYIPEPGDDPATTEVMAPRIEQLLVIAGDPGHQRFVDHLHFENLQFSYTTWTLPPEGYSFGQADIQIPAAIQAVGMRQCRLTGCAISHTGGWALDLAHGCSDNRISSCALYDLGAGGIKIGDGTCTKASRRRSPPQHGGGELPHRLRRAHLPGGDRRCGSASRITTPSSTARSTTSTTPGSRSAGPGAMAAANAHHNTIAYNHISRIGQGVLSDMGGIYNLGISPGTVFHHNRIHDIISASYGGWGLYTDEGSSGVLLQDNIVYRTSASRLPPALRRRQPPHQQHLRLRREAQLMRTRDEDHLSFTIERNLVLAHGDAHPGQQLERRMRAKFVLNRNLYWNEPAR
jgi:hypothetical protein